MFLQHHSDGYLDAVPGIKRKTLAYGASTLMTKFLLGKDSVLPRHSHPHEQTGYLVEGNICLTIGDEQFDVQPGDSWTIPGNVEHGATALTESVAVEVFAPVREDYLPEQG